MKTTDYYISGRHSANAKQAQLREIEQTHINKQSRIK
jgi:hypothetical protein